MIRQALERAVTLFCRLRYLFEDERDERDARDARDAGGRARVAFLEESPP